MIKKGILKQSLMKVILVLIAFFSLNIKVDAANFAYNAFDWDKFYEENVGYWTDFCKTNSGDISLEDCLEVTLSGKKEYYVRLYKLLSKYERKGYKLDDNILLVTSFYYLTPDSFSDLPEEYLRDYMDGTAYNIDTNENIDSYDVDTDEEIEYYLKETDSLKTLTKHMFSYSATCSGVVGTALTDDDGNKYCAQGTLSGNDCIATIDTYELNYSEYLVSKWNWIGKLFGIVDENKEECMNSGGTDYKVSNEKKINYDTYWEFLTESSYLDEKVHLTNKYNKILKATNHTLMKELSDDEREQYKEDLIEIRELIVLEMKSILEGYGEFAETPDSFTSAGCTGGSAWWPIGSDETTTEGDTLFAKGDPKSVSVSSPFGPRIHPISGILKQHTGIDIGNVSEGNTNVIAVKDGVVVYPTAGSPTNCPSSRSLDNCGGGYGNYVIIQHNDGTYSLYAHLYANSITVTANDAVKQGQVIGKIGSSGNSTGPHLHFEIRQGNNSSSATVDPLNIISAENPRSGGGSCSGSSSEFLKMLHWFEAGCNSPSNGNNYVVHDDGVGIPTVGYGVALKYNIDRFRQYGIDVSGVSFGAELPKDIVDKVELEETNKFRTYVQNELAKGSITLTEYQVDCLVMVSYQWGDIGNFNSVYKQYGNTESLRTSARDAQGGAYFAWNPSTGNGRAEATWKLFHEGIYTYDESRC